MIGSHLLISDIREFPAGNEFQADICIVGSGPAGLTLATELANTRMSVLVLESGGADGEHPFAAALNEIESIGAPRVMEQTKVRNRVLGGSSHTWSGRCAPFDAIDYETRPWLPCSGWPIGPGDVEPFLPRAAEYLGMLPLDGSRELLGELDLKPRLAGGDFPDLRSVFWQFSRHARDCVRFGPRFVQLDAPNIQVFVHATVTHIHTSENGARVESLEVAGPGGKRRTVKSRCFVLCGGGIENARMLLASNRRNPRGVGNARDQVGRFLMDHPRATIGTFAPEAVPALQPEFLPLRLPSGARIQQGFSLSFEAQRQEQLLNCAAWLTLHIADDDVWQALGRMRRDRGRVRLSRAAVVARSGPQAVLGAWRKLRGRPLPRRSKHLDLDVMVEQTPDPDSRIRLSSRRDALGVPLSEIDWRVGEAERRTVLRLGHAVHAALEQADLPTPELAGWMRDRQPADAAFHDPAHPIGTTRMAACPCHGVVDMHQQVFGIENLYIAGSSVFPTGSHANPTLMIVALSLRLAERLKTVHFKNI